MSASRPRTQPIGTERRRRLLALPAVLFALALLAPLPFLGRLPDPVAAHFTRGVPDSSAPLWLIVGVPVAVGCVPFIAWALVERRMRLPYGVQLVASICFSTYAGFCTAFVGCAVIATNVGAQRWQQARTPDWAPGALVLVTAAGAIGAAGWSWWLHTRRSSTGWTPPSPSRGVAEAGRGTVWIGHATNPALTRSAGVTALGCTIAALVLGFWPALVLAGLVMAASSLGRAVAVFDGQQLRIRPGRPWPWWTIDIDAVQSARVIQVNPATWNGWGLRYRVGIRALVARRGQGLYIVRNGAPDVVVTVDDAATGAALIARARLGQGPEDADGDASDG